jgi:hypothetical protein
MKHWLALIIVVSPLPALAQQRAEPAQQRTEPAPRRESYSDRYAVLSDHNIFLRDRSRPAPANATSQPATTRVPEESLVLTGVVIEEEGLRAYVEDFDTYSVKKVAVGDAIARGRVLDIDINAVEYEHAGERKWIEMGSNFLGRAHTLATSVAVSAPATTAPAGPGAASPSTQPSGAPANLNDPNLTLEQKMKLRRLQERKQ